MSTEDEDLELDFPCTRLKALYDYSYTDDDGHMISMNKGDEYHLISKSGDWWEVVRDAGSTNEFTFYVPASYVQEIDEGIKNSPRSDHSGDSTSDNNNEKIPITLVTGNDNVKTEMASSSSAYLNSGEVGVTFGKGTSSFKKSSDSGIHPSGLKPSSTNVPFRRSFSMDDGDYVNLDKYRTDAGLAEKDDEEASESDYANLTSLHPRNEPPSPDIEKCDYIKTLLDVWDMFHDPETNRLFYINKATSERTWKPPRHPNKHERAQQILVGPKQRISVAKLDAKVNRTGIGILPEINVDQTLTNIPEGWTVEETNDGTVYTNEVNEERWMSSINTEGKRYFYKVGSTETAWELPKINNRHSNGDIVHELPSPQASPSTRSRSPHIGRGVKAKSMFIESSVNFQHPPHFPTSPPPRAQTLPNNLNAQAGAEPSAEKSTFTPQQEPFSGTVSRAKIMEAGKKVKKSWITCYAKLTGSNLVFYKDVKAAKSVPGSPYGKSDFMVPLQGCQVSKATKDVSSKRNVINITTSHGDQYLVQVDDDKLSQKLHIQLEIKIKEMGPQAPEGTTVFSLGPPDNDVDEEDKLKRKTSFKRLFHSRSPSSGDGSLEKPKSKWLQNFFTRRPSKEVLEKQGIIQDAMFGGDLRIICDREKAKIPKFVMKCVVAIEKRGLDHDGIYRISGNQATIQKLRFQVDQDKYDLDAKEWDVYTLTGALKLFFRELKEPLLTFALFDKAVPALLKDSNAERLKIFKECINALPKNNYETFRFLCSHLLKVVELSKENRMEVQNIAIVFGPTLIWPKHENNHCIATNMVYQSRIVEYCLLESKAIFK